MWQRMDKCAELKGKTPRIDFIDCMVWDRLSAYIIYVYNKPVPKAYSCLF